MPEWINRDTKKQANAIAGGNFEKLLVEFQIVRTTFGEKFRTASSKNQFENSRASDILNIFFLNQEKIKESDPQVLDNSSPLDLEKLRRDPATPREVPGFLEKRFEIYGPTVISRLV